MSNIERGSSGFDLEAFRHWCQDQILGVAELRIEGVDRAALGHSAETLLLTLAWTDDRGAKRLDVAVRIRPVTPGLLEPYDLPRQFEILRRLETTPVPAPQPLWLEPTGNVVGREFYVMARSDGTVYESNIPAAVAADPARLRAMSRSIVDALAAIHSIDVDATDLGRFAPGDHLASELTRWGNEIARVQRGALPGLHRLGAELAARRPAFDPRSSLVHGDAKPGNFAFIDDAVSAVFDWELATIGDPRTDLGYLAAMWDVPGSFTALDGALTIDEALDYYAAQRAITLDDLSWYRALARYKLATIMLVGSMLFDAGHSDDVRLALMGFGVAMFTEAGLRDLGIVEPLEVGPVLARSERLDTVGIRHTATI